MRLINTSTLVIEEFLGRNIPRYAILSHTWEDEEVGFHDWSDPLKYRKKGFQKISRTCRLAAEDGLQYAWVDTCCIDKSNSAELSEAINSMYKWYQHAQICYVYLSDLPSVEKPLSLLGGCRWFTRGWTLQELLAPKAIRFHDMNWRYIGRKDWKMVLLISNITSIRTEILFGLKDVVLETTAAEKMSWAANRSTTREEDMAYCLLGIFDVNMPMLYGEGKKAFRRLQEEIIRSSGDISIFAWERSPRRHGKPVFCSAFAESPREFVIDGRHRHAVIVNFQGLRNKVTVTGAGVELSAGLRLLPVEPGAQNQYVLPVCRGGAALSGNAKFPDLGILLRKAKGGRFVRKNPCKLVSLGYHQLEDADLQSTNLTLLGEVPRPIYTRRTMEPRFRCFGANIVKAWPGIDWDAEDRSFITEGKSTCGSLLVQVELDARLRRPGRRLAEFMFLFCGPMALKWTTTIDETEQITSKWQQPCAAYTVVEYEGYHVALDIINLRIQAGDMTPDEMCRALTRARIPRQELATARIPGTGSRVTLRVGLANDTADLNSTLYSLYEFVAETKSNPEDAMATDKGWPESLPP